MTYIGRMTTSNYMKIRIHEFDEHFHACGRQMKCMVIILYTYRVYTFATAILALSSVLLIFEFNIQGRHCPHIFFSSAHKSQNN